jgi:hypothetical protein
VEQRLVIILHLEVDPAYDDPHMAAAQCMAAWANDEDVTIRIAGDGFHARITGLEVRGG